MPGSQNIVIYATTASGTVVPILVDASGQIQSVGA